jgi:hypothetical protein
MRRRLSALLALSLCGLLLAACSSSHVEVPWLRLSLRLPGATDTPAPQAALPSDTPEPTSTPPQVTVPQFVPIAERFVEEHRGHAFKTPVKVSLLDDAAFRQRLLSDETDTAAVDTTSKDLQALHLVDKGVDLRAAARDLLGAGVSGFYDPKSKDLVVRGVAASPYVRQVIVHELTHALQDQWFGIDRPELDKADDERASAFQAVVEGDAVRIENEYHDAMTPAEQRQADEEEQAQGGGLPSSVPRVLVELISFPYIVGPDFMEQLESIGGLAKVDDAFVHPPVSTAQLLDISRYLQGDAPKAVAAPRADATAFDHGVLGEFGLILLLENVAGMAVPPTRQVASLWGGDRYVAWSSGAKLCLRLAVVADRPGEQGPLDDALREYARAVAGGFTAGASGGPSTVTTCA